MNICFIIFDRKKGITPYLFCLIKFINNNNNNNNNNNFIFSYRGYIMFIFIFAVKTGILIVCNMNVVIIVNVINHFTRFI